MHALIFLHPPPPPKKKKKRYLFAFLTSLDTEIELCNPLEPPNFMNDAAFDLIFFFFYGTLIYFILLEYLLMLALYVKKKKKRVRCLITLQYIKVNFTRLFSFQNIF
jgi:hypothetical protein